MPVEAHQAEGPKGALRGESLPVPIADVCPWDLCANALWVGSVATLRTFAAGSKQGDASGPATMPAFRMSTFPREGIVTAPGRGRILYPSLRMVQVHLLQHMECAGQGCTASGGGGTTQQGRVLRDLDVMTS